jgi:hypothetical protein
MQCKLPEHARDKKRPPWHSVTIRGENIKGKRDGIEGYERASWVIKREWKAFWEI